MENLSSNLNHGNVISKLLVTLSGKAKLSIASCTVYEAMDWSSPLSLPCPHGGNDRSSVLTSGLNIERVVLTLLLAYASLQLKSHWGCLSRASEKRRSRVCLTSGAHNTT